VFERAIIFSGQEAKKTKYVVQGLKIKIDSKVAHIKFT
jgi:hypothetical protein